MKVLLFSDTHLTYFFDQRKYDFLASLINEADKVIINGDLWDGYFLSFNTFMLSRWSSLFPLLKEKNSVYISGNHDNLKKLDDRYLRFADELVDIYNLESAGVNFHIEHGDQHLKDILEILNPPMPISFIMERALGFSTSIESAGSMVAKWGFHESTGPYYYNLLNKKLKEAAAKISSEKDAYVIHGHSHYPEFDKENRYINLGCIKGGVASYAWIENGNVDLVKTTYGRNYFSVAK